MVEHGEREMIQSVFELGDTIAREVMVPRTEIVWIERTKTVPQALALALRSGFSRIPVIGENVDDIVGVVYLKDLARRGQDPERARTTRVDEVMRQPSSCRSPSRSTNCCARCRPTARTWRSSSTSTAAPPGWSRSRTSSRRSSARSPTSTTTKARPIERIDEDTARVTARLAVEDLASCSTWSCPTAMTSRRSAGCSPSDSAACRSRARRPG